MSLVVEFFGIPRQRAGVASIVLGEHELPATLGHLWSDLHTRFPQLEPALSPHVAINLDGLRFVQDPQVTLRGVTHVLVMSADAGG
jgi:molybdopterin converting factor small subunit